MSDILTKNDVIGLIEDRVEIKNGGKYEAPLFCTGEEAWYSEQIEASKMRFLKYYHSNPHPLHIKRGVFYLEDTDIYTPDINRMAEFSEGKLKEKNYNKILEMKKVFDTPDKVFTEVMEESETFKQIGRMAPEEEKYLYNNCRGIHSSTIQAKDGDLVKLRETFKNVFEKIPNDWIKGVNETTIFPNGHYGTFAHHLRTTDYLNKKGLDGLVVDMNFPSIDRFDVEGDSLVLRNFVYNDNREELEEQMRNANKLGSWYTDFLINRGFSVSRKKEFIEPVGNKNNRFNIIGEIKKGDFKFLEKPPEIPE